MITLYKTTNCVCNLPVVLCAYLNSFHDWLNQHKQWQNLTLMRSKAKNLCFAVCIRVENQPFLSFRRYILLLSEALAQPVFDITKTTHPSSIRLLVMSLNSFGKDFIPVRLKILVNNASLSHQMMILEDSTIVEYHQNQQ